MKKQKKDYKRIQKAKINYRKRTELNKEIQVKALEEVAKNTLKMGMDIEIIMKVTELSKEEIEEIKKDIQEDNSN